MEDNNKGDNIFNEVKEGPIVVGIGASAGGLEAIQEFFSHANPESNLSYVVVQHLSPDYKSLMDELLAKHTQLNIFKVKDGIEIQEKAIYLIPPGKNMTIFHNKLFLTNQDPKRGINLPIDIFFRSLAKEKGKDAIAIILSGTGSDGTLGIRAIKESGGMVMVQDDKSAKFDGMPRSSIATGMVDFILSPGEMPESLINYIKHPYISKEKKLKDDLYESGDSLTKIIMLIREYSGIDFSYYKPNTIIRRIEKRVGVKQFEDLESYITYLETNSEELEILYNELLIGVTRFFRDKEAFDLVSEKAIPKLLKGVTAKSQVRIWSAGCSTGEEAYSIAILFKEYMDKNSINADVKIFATDLDKESIEYAGIGVYPENVISDISPERLQKYFYKKGESYQVIESIRRMVVFATQNIIKDPPFSKIDLVICRNMLIYFKPETQQKILSMFYFALKQNGFLFLGGSESIGEFINGFTPVNSKWKLFKYNAGFKPELIRDLAITSVSRKELRSTGFFGTETKKSFEKTFFDVLLNQLLNQYLPPSVILDENYNILHIIQDVNKYLKLPQGNISYNILKLIHEDISIVLSSILRKVKKENGSVVFEDIPLKLLDGKKIEISLQANILRDDRAKASYYIVSFTETKAIKKVKVTKEKIDVNSQYHERLVELEKELQFTKESLQATVEELETSNEELQSSNEELIASNEELQSTNEELQSVNEELYTVNAEYQNKIEELTELNNDIDNLLKNSDIGTIFLDTEFRIRKITDQVYDYLSILKSDIGRPMYDLSFSNLYKGFIEDVKKVTEKLKVIEKEVKIKKSYYLVKIIPYRNEEGAVKGILINFVNIDRIERVRNSIVREKDLLHRVLDSSLEGKTMVNEKGEIEYINKRGEELFGLTQKEILLRTYDDHQWDIADIKGKKIPSSKLPFAKVMKTKKAIKNFEHYITRPDKTKVLLKINGAPVFDENNEVVGAVFSITEV